VAFAAMSRRSEFAEAICIGSVLATGSNERRRGGGMVDALKGFTRFPGVQKFIIIIIPS